MTESDAMAVVSLVIVVLFLRWQFREERMTRFFMDLIVIWAGALASVYFVTWGPVDFQLLNKIVALAGAATLLIFGTYKTFADVRKEC